MAEQQVQVTEPSVEKKDDEEHPSAKHDIDPASLICDPNLTMKDGKAYVITKRPESTSGKSHSEAVAADPTPIELVADAEEVDLNHSRVATMANFTVLAKAETIGLRNNMITRIEGISQLVGSLRELELYDNQITRIENLDELVNLEVLDISFNRLTKIEGLEKLVNLRKLFLVNNKIEVIENLDTLVNLDTLELGANRIRKIENLGHLSKLTQLYLGKNKITELENLGELKALTLLSIQSNRIVSMKKGLEELTELDQLYISHNGLQEIEGLEKNVKLTTLDVAGNQIKRLTNIEHLQLLEDFWVNDNLVEDWRNLEAVLGKLPALQTIYLERNPVAADPMYRKKLMLIAPKLRQIDATMCRAA